jgi:electron transport complex protein RnfG
VTEDRRLPMVGPEEGGDAGAQGGQSAGEASAPGAPVQVEVPSWRLVLTLATAGALAGLAIVLVFSWAQPRIDAHRALVLQQSVQEVLKDPSRFEPLFVLDGEVTATLPAGVDSTDADRVFLGFDDGGVPVGFAVQGEASGYQDVIRLIFGYDHREGTVIAMKVLESKETPGLGDKIIKDLDFVGGFEGALGPLLGIKTGESTGDPQEVEMITGATISSRTVIDIINAQIARLGPALQSYEGGGDR